MALSPSTTSLTFPVALIPQSIITKKHCDKTDISYSDKARLYFYVQPPVFYHTVLNDDVNTFLYFSSSIKKICVR